LKLAVFCILCENSTAPNDQLRRGRKLATSEPKNTTIQRKPRMRSTTGKAIPIKIAKLESVGGTPFMLPLTANAFPGTL
jgi:hypothetical protein